MPKIKSHRGAMKRFKVTASGRIKLKKAGARHILTKRSRANKRKKKALVCMPLCDAKNIKKLICT